MAAENSSGSGSSKEDSGLLTSVAESIGSTLGSLVARAGAAQKSISTAASETVATVKKATTKARPARKRARRAPARKTSVKRAVNSAEIQELRRRASAAEKQGSDQETTQRPLAYGVCFPRHGRALLRSPI